MSWESLVKDAREMFRVCEKVVPPPPNSNKHKHRKQKSTKKKPAQKSSTVPPTIPPMPARSNLVSKKFDVKDLGWPRPMIHLESLLSRLMKT